MAKKKPKTKKISKAKVKAKISKKSKKTVKKVKKTKKAKPISKISPSVPKTILALGKPAPSFSCKNQNGQTISLEALKGQNVVLYFYPKDMTPGCTQEACDFRDSLNRIKSTGGVVLGVSKDDENLHQKFIEKYSLNFDLLADTDGSVCEAYGVIQEKSMYGKTFMGIVRSTFLIDKNGNLAKIYPKVKVEGHVQEIINDLSQLT